MNNTVHLALAIDEHYETGLVGTLASAIRNIRKGYFLEIRVIDCGIKHRQEIQESLEPLNKGQFSLTFWKFQREFIKGIPVVVDYLSDSAFANLTLASQFPDWDKVLFLDADLLVHRDISTLWETPLQGWPLGAVRDQIAWVLGYDVKNCDELGIDPQSPYFNSGVLLADLAYWREHQVEEQILAHAGNTRIQRSFNDQTFLNLTFRGRWLELPQRWNRFTVILPGQHHLIPLEPSIFHLTYKYKPWLFPRKKSSGMIRLFYHYLSRTDWERFWSPDPEYDHYFSWRRELRRALRFYLGEIGLNPVFNWMKQIRQKQGGNSS